MNTPRELYSVDLASGMETLEYAATTESLGRPVFGRDDETIFVPRCELDTCDILAIDRSGQRAPTPLGVPSWTLSPTLSWGRIAVEIDANGDGIADGIGA